ncbi:MAG: carbohydrate ABC transporter permease [Thermomicrobiales bacterium]
MAAIDSLREPVPRAALGWSGARLQNALVQSGRYAVLVFFLVVSLYPVVLMWASALKTSREIARDPLALPSSLNMENLQTAWTVGRFDRYLGNSVLYSIAIVTGVVVLSSLAGYSLARLRVAHHRVVFIGFLLGLMVPFQSIMIPLYYLLRDMNVLGTYWAMILPSIGLGLPFGVFYMRAFFRGLPGELADAARVDGGSEWQVFAQIMLPLARPGLATLAVFQLMTTWNSFLVPLVFVQRDELRPIALGAMFFSGRYTADRGLIAAGVTISIVPIVILYLFMQRQFIRGITAGALKGE